MCYPSYRTPGHSRIATTALLALLVATPAVIAQPAIQLASPRTGVLPATDFASRPVVSADGLHVVFTSRTLSTSLATATQIYVFNRITGQLAIVSSTNGLPSGLATSACLDPTASATGRYVAFSTSSNTFVANRAGIIVLDRDADTDGSFDETAAGSRTFAWVSSASSGTTGAASALQPSISATGRFVAFVSSFNGLVPGDTNTGADVFVKDRDADTDGIFDETAAGSQKTVRVNVDSAGQQTTKGNSARPSISADGRFVVFSSDSPNLVANEVNDLSAIFLHDRDADTDGIFDEPGAIATTRVSVAFDGSPLNGNSYEPTISADGRCIAFVSYAGNVLSGMKSGVSQVYLHDRTSGTTQLISRSEAGVPGAFYSFTPRLNGDGRLLVFYSAASNLVPGDTNSAFDAFLWDRIAPGNGLSLIDLAADGSQADFGAVEPSISADGRIVAFASVSGDFEVDGDPSVRDAFVADRNPCLPELYPMPPTINHCAGKPLTIHAPIVGAGNFEFQWLRNGQPIPDATNSALAFTSLQMSDAAPYSVIVTSDCGSATSSAVALAVFAPLTIVTQPLSSRGCNGTPLTLSVEVSGGAQTYQWRRNGVAIAGANSLSYTMQSSSSSETVSFDVVISNPCGMITSAAARVLFDLGGQSGCSSWRLRDVAVKPAPRSGAGMISSFEVAYMFGGITEQPDEALWTWNGTNWQSSLPAFRPPQRSGHAMTNWFGNILMFGGLRRDGATSAETWMWDESDGWHLFRPSLSPQPRTDAAMANVPSLGTILFGGRNAAGDPLNDTWIWSNEEWIQISPANSPSPRLGHVCVVPFSSINFWITGGSSGADETWSFNGTNWAKLNLISNAPPRIFAGATAFSGANSVLFGGIGSTLHPGAWTRGPTPTSGWMAVVRPTSPPPRFGHAMSYDPYRNTIVMFGGTSIPDGTRLNDTWEFSP